MDGNDVTVATQYSHPRRSVRVESGETEEIRRHTCYGLRSLAVVASTRPYMTAADATTATATPSRPACIPSRRVPGTWTSNPTIAIRTRGIVPAFSWITALRCRDAR